MTNNRNFYLFLLILVLLVIISALSVPLVSNAAKYAQVSREIFENHEWINLTIGGDAYDQKPPLLFWIGAIFFHLFGFSIPVYKIAVILFSTLGIFSTYKLGSLLYTKNTGIFAAIFWATSLGYLHFHNDIHTDTLLASFVVFAVWQLSAFFKYRKNYQFILGIAGVGLSMLTKGPIGMAIPAFAIGTNLLYQKKFADIFNLRWLIALVLVAIIISPALIGLINQFGVEGIKFYFWTNNMGRITGSYYGSNTDYSFYIHNSLYVLAPWTAFVFTGIALEIGDVFKRKFGKGEILNIGSILLFIGILSVAKTKNPHYLLGIAPFMFIVAAKWAVLIFEENRFRRLQKILPAVNKVVAVLLIVLAVIFPLYIFPEKSFLFWIVFIALAGGCFFFLFQKNNLKQQVIMLAISVAAIMFTINRNALPNMQKFHSSFEAAEYFNEKAPANSTLNIYKQKARLWSLFLYSKHPGKFLVTPNDLKNFIPKPGAWIYTTEDGLKEIQEMNIDFSILKEYRHKTLTKQSINFLNPKTREQHFNKMFLLQLN